ncbi:hypothetical protein MHYP_G00116260 [Metynnis hypsauchen]
MASLKRRASRQLRLSRMNRSLANMLSSLHSAALTKQALINQGKEHKPVVTLPNRFPLLSVKGSARNSAVCRGLPSTTSTITSTRPPVNAQVLQVLGAGPKREKPGDDGEAVLMKPHPPKGRSRPMKSALLQAVAPVRRVASQGKEHKPVVTLPNRFPLLSVKGSARNSAAYRGLPSTTSTITSTRPPVNAQVLQVLGAGPKREKPGNDGEAVLMKPHPPKGRSRPMKSALLQAVAPVRRVASQGKEHKPVVTLPNRFPLLSVKGSARNSAVCRGLPSTTSTITSTRPPVNAQVLQVLGAGPKREKPGDDGEAVLMKPHPPKGRSRPMKSALLQAVAPVRRVASQGKEHKPVVTLPNRFPLLSVKGSARNSAVCRGLPSTTSTITSTRPPVNAQVLQVLGAGPKREKPGDDGEAVLMKPHPPKGRSRPMKSALLQAVAPVRRVASQGKEHKPVVTLPNRFPLLSVKGSARNSAVCRGLPSTTSTITSTRPPVNAQVLQVLGAGPKREKPGDDGEAVLMKPHPPKGRSRPMKSALLQAVAPVRRVASQGKEHKPVVTLPNRFPLLSGKGSARNSAVCRGLPSTTSTITSTRPPVTPQVLQVLGAGPKKEKPGDDGEAVLMKPHPPKGRSRPMKSALLQAVAPVRRVASQGKEHKPVVTLPNRFPLLSVKGSARNSAVCRGLPSTTSTITSTRPPVNAQVLQVLGAGPKREKPGDDGEAVLMKPHPPKGRSRPMKSALLQAVAPVRRVASQGKEHKPVVTLPNRFPLLSVKGSARNSAVCRGLPSTTSTITSTRPPVNAQVLQVLGAGPKREKPGDDGEAVLMKPHPPKGRSRPMKSALLQAVAPVRRVASQGKEHKPVVTLPNRFPLLSVKGSARNSAVCRGLPSTTSTITSTRPPVNAQVLQVLGAGPKREKPGDDARNSAAYRGLPSTTSTITSTRPPVNAQVLQVLGAGPKREKPGNDGEAVLMKPHPPKGRSRPMKSALLQAVASVRRVASQGKEHKPVVTLPNRFPLLSVKGSARNSAAYRGLPSTTSTITSTRPLVNAQVLQVLGAGPKREKPGDDGEAVLMKPHPPKGRSRPMKSALLQAVAPVRRVASQGKEHKPVVTLPNRFPLLSVKGSARNSAVCRGLPSTTSTITSTRPPVNAQVLQVLGAGPKREKPGDDGEAVLMKPHPPKGRSRPMKSALLQAVAPVRRVASQGKEHKPVVTLPNRFPLLSVKGSARNSAVCRGLPSTTSTITSTRPPVNAQVLQVLGAGPKREKPGDDGEAVLMKPHPPKGRSRPMKSALLQAVAPVRRVASQGKEHKPVVTLPNRFPLLSVKGSARNSAVCRGLPSTTSTITSTRPPVNAQVLQVLGAGPKREKPGDDGEAVLMKLHPPKGRSRPMKSALLQAVAPVRRVASQGKEHKPVVTLPNRFPLLSVKGSARNSAAYRGLPSTTSTITSTRPPVNAQVLQVLGAGPKREKPGDDGEAVLMKPHPPKGRSRPMKSALLQAVAPVRRVASQGKEHKPVVTLPNRFPLLSVKGSARNSAAYRGLPSTTSTITSTRPPVNAQVLQVLGAGPKREKPGDDGEAVLMKPHPPKGRSRPMKSALLQAVAPVRRVASQGKEHKPVVTLPNRFPLLSVKGSARNSAAYRGLPSTTSTITSTRPPVNAQVLQVLGAGPKREKPGDDGEAVLMKPHPPKGRSRPMKSALLQAVAPVRRVASQGKEHKPVVTLPNRFPLLSVKGSARNSAAYRGLPSTTSTITSTRPPVNAQVLQVLGAGPKREKPGDDGEAVLMKPHPPKGRSRPMKSALLQAVAPVRRVASQGKEHKPVVTLPNRFPLLSVKGSARNSAAYRGLPSTTSTITSTRPPVNAQVLQVLGAGPKREKPGDDGEAVLMKPHPPKGRSRPMKSALLQAVAPVRRVASQGKEHKPVVTLPNRFPLLSVKGSARNSAAYRGLPSTTSTITSTRPPVNAQVLQVLGAGPKREKPGDDGEAVLMKPHPPKGRSRPMKSALLQAVAPVRRVASQGKEHKPVVTLPNRFPLLSVKGSARNSAVCRGLPSTTSTITSTRPPVNAQVLQVLGAGPKREKPGDDGEAVLMKPHPPKGRSRPMKSALLQAVAPVRRVASQGKEHKPVVTLPNRFPLLSVKGSARNSAAYRGLPSTTSTITSTRPLVNAQVLQVLGAGPKREKPGDDGEAVLMKPHPPKGRSRPMKSALLQAVAPVRRVARFPLLSVKGSARNSAAYRGLPSTTSTITSTRPPVNAQVLQVLGAGPKREKPGDDGEAVLMKPHPPKGRSRPMKSALLQAVAPVRRVASQGKEHKPVVTLPNRFPLLSVKGSARNSAAYRGLPSTTSTITSTRPPVNAQVLQVLGAGPKREKPGDDGEAVLMKPHPPKGRSRPMKSALLQAVAPVRRVASQGKEHKPVVTLPNRFPLLSVKGSARNSAAYRGLPSTTSTITSTRPPVNAQVLQVLGAGPKREKPGDDGEAVLMKPHPPKGRSRPMKSALLQAVAPVRRVASQGKEHKPVVTLPNRFPLLSVKGSARNSAAYRGLPSTTSTITSTRPPVNAQVLQVLGAGPKREKPGDDGEAVLMKPHPPKGRSRPMKSALLQAVAPVRRVASQGKEHKPVVTLPNRFPLLSVKGSARNSAAYRGLPSTTSTITSTRPPVNAQVLQVLGAGPKREKPGDDGEAVLMKPHPPKGRSRPMKSALLQAVAPVRRVASQGKEHKPVVTLPNRFPLLSVKGSARNSAVCRGLPSTTSTITSTRPPVTPQVLQVLGAGPKKEKPGDDGEAVLMKPHPPKGRSRPMKSALLQAVAPVRKLKESSLDLTVEGEVVRRGHTEPPAHPKIQLLHLYAVREAVKFN